MTRQPSIAFFDFDGTITTKDTLLEIIKYSKGNTKFITGFLKLSPWLLAMKMKLLSNQQVKQKVLTYFFSGDVEKELSSKCQSYLSSELPKILRPQALQEIERHKANSTIVVVVSASPELWVKEWCLQNDLLCIGTKLVTKNGLITGEIEGKNCYGQEKVNRIKQAFQLESFEEISCYGDTKGDKPMLSLATFSYYKPFRSR